MKKSLVLLLVVGLAIGILGGCTTDETQAGESAGEEIGEAAVNRGKVVVSSKEWTEPLILGEITMQYLGYLGYEVGDRTALGPTPVVREAMRAGEIDLYWDYASSICLLEAGIDRQLGFEESYDLGSSFDLETNNIVWGAPTTANDTYVLITTPAFAEELGITTISKLAEKIQEGVAVRTFFGLETFERPDGIPGLESHYGFEFDRELLTTGMTGLDHETLKAGKADVAMGLSTQGQIKRFNEFVIEDDMEFFAPYMPIYMVRGEIVEENSMLVEEMDMLCPYITNENLIVLNDAVDLGGESVSDVAERFLKDNGLIE